MNRSRAKLLTVTGFICLLTGINLSIANLTEWTSFPLFISLAIFVGGIVLIVLSLAYYTEK